MVLSSAAGGLLMCGIEVFGQGLEMSLSYRKQLAEDLPRWVAEGWVRPEGA